MDPLKYLALLQCTVWIWPSCEKRGGGVCDVIQRAPVCTSGPFSTNDDVMDNMAPGVDLACEPVVV